MINNISDHVESISLQTLLAPAFKALLRKKGHKLLVTFSSFPDLDREKALQEFQDRGLEGLFLEEGQGIENLYTALEKSLSDRPDIRALAVAGLGLFVARNMETLPGRIAGKIAVVTGSAQGFGEGIARGLAEEGAYVVIADLNYELASQVSKDISDRYGRLAAYPVKVNVADEKSVADMVDAVVARYGGLDVFVSNAGVVRAGSLEEMTLSNFSFVTDINYTGYFLGAKYASIPMKIYNRFYQDEWSDIIQINSKSGLDGSNKNFAYAGSKFGGIGLTQSFGLELVDYNIKVNSICPGNFYDGPLWSDPDKGLFVSYLKAGKIPGAKTVDDVKKAYLAKSPIKRGCLPSDVTKAILYCMEQGYETGQAIPVTGGQNMLK